MKKQFQGVQWQRCQTHFFRNVLGFSPRHHRKAIADKLPHIFTVTDKVTARGLADALIKNYEGKAAKSMDFLEAGLEYALTVLGLP